MTISVTCGCKQNGDGSTMWEPDCPEHGREAIMRELLPPGTPIRHRRHPELTGKVKAHEWTGPGEISPIPYNIAWDDEDRAYDVLGWFWIYATIESVEHVEATPTKQEQPDG